MSQHLDQAITDYTRNEKKLEDAVREFESRYISHVLQAARGNRSLAARRLGIHRNTLINKLNRIAARAR